MPLAFQGVEFFAAFDKLVPGQLFFFNDALRFGKTRGEGQAGRGVEVFGSGVGDKPGYTLLIGHDALKLRGDLSAEFLHLASTKIGYAGADVALPAAELAVVFAQELGLSFDVFQF